MVIGIDARELCGRRTGVGRYLTQLIEAWSDDPAARAHRVICYQPGAPHEDTRRALDALRADLRTVPGLGGTLWEQVALPRAVRRDAPDVFFAPAYTAPILLRVPTVLTIHDLSYMARPDWYRPRERWRRAIVTRASAQRARAIVTDSVFSQQEVTRLLGIPSARITVIPLGLGMAPSEVQCEPRAPLVLFVGSVFNRRRLPDLVAAFARVSSSMPDARLEIVGENRTWPHIDIDGLVAGSGAAARIRVRSWIPDADLASLYRQAAVFVFLSEYEGFGLTPLEALAHGVPAVVLDTAVAREVCGRAALFVQPGDVAGTAEAIRTLLVEADTRRRVLAEAATLLPRYSWPAAARATRVVLEGAAR